MFEVVTCVFIYFIPQNDSCTRCWLFCTHLSLVHSFPNLESTPHLDSLDSVTFLKAPSRKRHPGLEKEREQGIYKIINSANKPSSPLAIPLGDSGRTPIPKPCGICPGHFRELPTFVCLHKETHEGRFIMESSQPWFDDQTPV